LNPQILVVSRSISRYAEHFAATLAASGLLAADLQMGHKGGGHEILAFCWLAARGLMRYLFLAEEKRAIKKQT
jgi:hypothetical protein